LSTPLVPTLRVIGPGRAGLSLSRALDAAGWRVLPPLGRDDDLRAAAAGTDLLVIATPDAAVASVAASIDPVPTTVVAHMAGSLGLAPLAAHPRRSTIHPLVALPDPDLGARCLRGAWFAVAGDPLGQRVVADLEGTAIEVADGDRAAYHAAACVASNHLVALLGSVERIAATAGVPLAAYLDLVRATVDNVEALGPDAALTGPAARGDWKTIERHRAVLPEREREAYEALLGLISEREPAPCK
jgi:predicted short-subunit dehydrogenase-like oxidoreductase (DUF2520 family)